MNGLMEATSGKIFVDDVDITKKGTKLIDIRKKVGLVFQYSEYQLFEETIEKDIAFGPKNLGMNDDIINERVKSSMEMVGLDYEVYKDKSILELAVPYIQEYRSKMGDMDFGREMIHTDWLGTYKDNIDNQRELTLGGFRTFNNQLKGRIENSPYITGEQAANLYYKLDLTLSAYLAEKKEGHK